MFIDSALSHLQIQYRGYTIDFEPRSFGDRFYARVAVRPAASPPEAAEVHDPHIASFRLQEAAASFGRRFGELWVDAHLDGDQPSP